MKIKRIEIQCNFTKWGLPVSIEKYPAVFFFRVLFIEIGFWKFLSHELQPDLVHVHLESMQGKYMEVMAELQELLKNKFVDGQITTGGGSQTYYSKNDIVFEYIFIVGFHDGVLKLPEEAKHYLINNYPKWWDKE